MTLSAPNVALIRAHNRVRKLRSLFNRTQVALIEANAAYEAQVKLHGREIVSGGRRYRIRTMASAPSYTLKQEALGL